MGRTRWLQLLVVLVGGLLWVAPAAALPANPWTGLWLIPKAKISCNDRPALGISGDQVFTATQSGSRVTFTYTYPGGQAGAITGNVSPDGLHLHRRRRPRRLDRDRADLLFGTGHGAVQFQMAADANSFTTIPGGGSQTDLGNIIDISGTYQGGGTEPRPLGRPARAVPGAASGGSPRTRSPWCRADRR